jgi:osmotically-inducible protein OsmY
MKRNPALHLATALSLAWLLAPACANATDKPPAASNEVTEALDALSVKATLIDKLGADALAISVSVSGQTATLTGEVTKSPSQGLAEEVALSVAGIRKVNNVALEMKVKTILLTEIGANALKIEVEAVDGIVSLRGRLDNPDTSKAAVKKTQAIKGVKKVVDLLG